MALNHPVLHRPLINKLKRILNEPLPGMQAQSLLVPFKRNLVPPEQLREGEYKPSAVMILLCRDQDEKLFFPLIQRFSYKGPHSGQISLPGGKFEPADQDLQQTAIRECFEEIGLGFELEMLGKLSPLYIPVSEFLVHPYVAYCQKPVDVFTPHEREVEEVLKMYLSDFLNDGTLQNGKITTAGFDIEAPYFSLDGRQVWGATAMILSELRELLRSVS